LIDLRDNRDPELVGAAIAHIAINRRPGQRLSQAVDERGLPVVPDFGTDEALAARAALNGNVTRLVERLGRPS
jgi:hypothetical protein